MIYSVRFIMIHFSVLLFLLLISVSDQSFNEEPLILTRFIEEGDIIGGQEAARVEPFISDVKSYSGFFTIDFKYDSNMFFWYFPCEDSKAPLVVWLQGGPGDSSMYGLFYENGPLFLKNKEVIRREYSWTRVAHMIYIDNPIGTGFSHTNSSYGYATDQSQIGDGLYLTILQFLTLFPHLQENGLYIAGESYAGKYVPAMAYAIHQNNPSSELKINLKGLAIGDGLCDPVNMLGYGDYLYQIGFIDDEIKNEFKAAEDKTRNLIEDGEYYKAALIWTKFFGKSSLMANVTGVKTYYNYYSLFSDEAELENVKHFLTQSWVREKIHVGDSSFNSTNSIVSYYLFDDILKSMTPWLKVLTDNYRVMFYSGQLDIIIAYPLTVNFLRNFEWCGYQEYLRTARKIWKVNGELAGYSRTVKPINCNGSLTEVLVRNAGHMVPHDQPQWAFNLISKFLNNEDF